MFTRLLMFTLYFIKLQEDDEKMNNLAKLFKTQKLLDNRIVDKHNLHGQDLLPKKILALQVELGELAQNWRGFKFWSRDQEPRTELFDEEYDLIHMESVGLEQKNPLLEEYVDCLHFILSIGNDLELNIELYTILPIEHKTILDQFSRTYYVISDLEHDPSQEELIAFLQYFLGLGEMLGFTPEQIEQSYYQKNAINHQRQTDHY